MNATYGCAVPTEQTYPNDWARFIDELANRPGWTQARLATATGVHRNTLRRYVRGTSTNVTQEIVEAIAKGGGVDPRLALAAATGLQRQIEAEDQDDIRYIQENAPAELKDKLIDLVHRMRTDQAAERRRAVDLILEATQTGN
jgi:transcriptional regulator with XRE-family HTH domain